MKALLNEAIVPVEEAKVSVLDRGFLYGDAVFETMSVSAGRIFRLAAHCARFRRSAELIGMSVPFPDTKLQDQLHRVLAANACRDGILRMSLTRGTSGRGVSTEGCHDPTFVALCFPPRTISPELRTHGAKVVVTSIRRMPSSAVPAAAKTGNLLNGILAYREATAKSADEALMLTVDDLIAEGAVSNFFFVQDGTLVTPSVACGILPGITRAAVLEVAATLHIPIRETSILASALSTVEEAFYTNTTIGIMPVRCIDSHAFAAPGPITSRLIEGFAALVRQSTTVD